MEAPGSITKKGGEAWFIEISRDYENRRNALKDLSRKQQGGDDTVPTAAVSSFRNAADRRRKAITQRSGGSSRAATTEEGGEQTEEAAPTPAAEAVSDEELISTMQAQWVEVECLLRVQLRSPEALEEARRRVNDSLSFDEVLVKEAESCGQLKGTIFQALLAFVDGRAESTASSCGSGVGTAEWEELARGSDALRKLVRIKVQDDNDLKAANLALKSCAEFFDNLKVYSARNSLEETAVLAKLEE